MQDRGAAAGKDAATVAPQHLVAPHPEITANSIIIFMYYYMIDFIIELKYCITLLASYDMMGFITL